MMVVIMMMVVITKRFRDDNSNMHRAAGTQGLGMRLRLPTPTA